MIPTPSAANPSASGSNVITHGSHCSSLESTNRSNDNSSCSAVYTYVTAPPVTKAHEFHRQDVNHYVEIENDAKSIDL
ncbi:hypothetical protein H5410_020406 [Solanum commersonii]|uniref:Uncharacterized protein n=1 Tax=Solanum commersonii TaxID=4109 RepID=A0A9J5Z9Y1_SOLCO|nr:hypothetical protein H5410_020406 [Solanum commersonii]